MSREGKKRWGFWETFTIGKQDNPMMKRLRIVQTPWFGLYAHFIYREDLDPVPHDHPWNFWRMVIRGGYIEHFFDDPIEGEPLLRYLGPWRPNRITVDQAHRITWVAPGTVSLVLVGKKQRVWGFWTPEDLSGVGEGYGWESRTWVDYRDALNLRPSEGVHSQDKLSYREEILKDDPIFMMLTDAIPPADPPIQPPVSIEEAIRRARESLTGVTPDQFREGECLPTGECSCLGHRPGFGMAVSHIVPCCDTPHVDQAILADGAELPANDVRPSTS